MTSPAGPQSHFLFRWMASSSRAGVILNGSPEELGSIKSICTTQGMDVALDDSFSAHFAPLPISRSSSCTSVDLSVDASQSRVAPVSTPPCSEVATGCAAAGKPQALIDRLQQLKQLQQYMQQQLKAHQQEQLQKLPKEQPRPSGMMQAAAMYNHIEQPGFKSTAQPRRNSSHASVRDSPVNLVLRQPENVERPQELIAWNQEPTVDQASSGHYAENSAHGESPHSEDESACQKDGETEPRDRPIRSGAGGRAFEEMLEEQLRLENEKLSKISGVSSDAVKVKRPFLRRGEGLSRFTRGKTARSFRDKATGSDVKPPPDADHVSCPGQSSKPNRTPPKSLSATNGVTRRKTAVLNKKNLPQKTLAPATECSAKAYGHRSFRNVRVEGQNKHPGPERHQNRNDDKPESEKVSSHIAVDEVGEGAGQFYGMTELSARAAESSFEVWLKERGEHWERDRHREHVELGEFELLEKAADEVSFSSNSSFVSALLRRDCRRLSSTPVKSPPEASFVDSAAAIEGTKARPERVTTECSERDGVEGSDSSACSSTIFYQPATIPNLQTSAAPYDQRIYQDGAGSPDSERDSTLVDTRGQVEFDDDDTWNEPESSISSPAKTDDEPDRVLRRKIAVSKGADQNHETGPPPTCQLVAKLFPALKPKPCPLPAVVPEAEGQSEQGAAKSAMLRERLVELETEIERFRKENAALSRLRQENQEIQENMRRERAEFQKNMADELANWEEFKREESRKLQREKRLFEKHAAAARARPDKQERDEIQSLKQQLNTLQEDLKKREARWSSTHSRLRQQIDSANAEISTLRDQVRTLEKLRLSTWRNAAPDRDKERGRTGGSDNNDNGRTTTSMSPPIRGTSSPPENSMRTVAQNLRQNPDSSTKFSTDQQKEPCPVASSLHVSDHATACEEVDTPRNITAASEPSEQDNMVHIESKIEKTCPDGGRLTVFPNGTKKQVSADGLTVTITFFNGDVKKIMPDQSVIYYYAEAQTTQTTYPDGLEVLQFPNNQIEKHYTDGHKEIVFPDQSVKHLYPDGREESVLLDGTIIQQNPDGTKQIQFSTGQRELHTADFKRREYPDGTVKTVYSDGRQETRYPDGRVRLKNPEGFVAMDTC